MPDGRSRGRVGSGSRESSLVLTRRARGGFVLAESGGREWKAEPGLHGLVVTGKGSDPLHLIRVVDQGDGYVLRHGIAGDGEEVARSSRPPGGRMGVAGTSILREDGRLFRIVSRGTRTASYGLADWDSPGAFFEARPVTRGWRFVPTLAGSLLAGAEPVLIVFAAEILDGEGSGADSPMQFRAVGSAGPPRKGRNAAGS